MLTTTTSTLPTLPTRSLAVVTCRLWWWRTEEVNPPPLATAQAATVSASRRHDGHNAAYTVHTGATGLRHLSSALPAWASLASSLPVADTVAPDCCCRETCFVATAASTHLDISNETESDVSGVHGPRLFQHCRWPVQLVPLCIVVSHVPVSLPCKHLLALYSLL